VSAELFLSHIFTLSAAFVAQQLLSFLNYVIPEALPPSLMGSALASGQSVSEPAGTGSAEHRGNF